MTIKHKPKHHHRAEVSSSVLFKYTDKEHETINAPFRRALLNLKSSKGTQTDWFNVTFRVRSAYAIALQMYEDVTIAELKDVCDMCEAIESRSKKVEHKHWEATVQELEWIEAAFDAVEELQRTVPRKLFFDCCVRADQYLRGKYVNRSRWGR